MDTLSDPVSLCATCGQNPRMKLRSLCKPCAKEHDAQKRAERLSKPRTCKKCGLDDWMPSGSCRECKRAYNAAKQAAKIAAAPPKYCQKCQTVEVTGRSLQCPECRQIVAREKNAARALRSKRNWAPECKRCGAKREYGKRCKACHEAKFPPEERKERQARQVREWNERNAHKRQAAHREKWLSDPEYRAKAAENGRRWRQENPEKSREGWRRRRARKLAAEGTHTVDDVLKQLERQKGRCHWCHEPMGDAHTVDHVVPLSKGGSDGPENIVAACSTCNSSKHNKMAWEFAGRLF